MSSPKNDGVTYNPERLEYELVLVMFTDVKTVLMGNRRPVKMFGCLSEYMC